MIVGSFVWSNRDAALFQRRFRGVCPVTSRNRLHWSTCIHSQPTNSSWELEGGNSLCKTSHVILQFLIMLTMYVVVAGWAQKSNIRHFQNRRSSASLKTRGWAYLAAFHQPPEMFLDDSMSSTASDVYLYGVLLWEIFNEDLKPPAVYAKCCRKEEIRWRQLKRGKDQSAWRWVVESDAKLLGWSDSKA